MGVQYLSNKKGQITAVQVPIEEWNKIKRKYPDVDHIDSEVPEWHKELIDSRLEILETEADRVKPISGLLDELDQ